MQTGHQHHRGRPTGVGDLQGLATEDVGEFLIDEFDDLLAGIERLRRLDADRTLANARHQVAHDTDVHVGLEQRGADLLQDLVDVGLGEATFAADSLEDAVETVGEIVEHDDRRLPPTRDAVPVAFRVRGGQPTVEAVTTSSTTVRFTRSAR